MAQILLLYDSRGGLTEQLAGAVREGIESAGAECIERRVEDASPDDLLLADGLVLGSPNWTGMTGTLKAWWDQSGDLWESGELAGIPAGAFTAGYSRSAGTEATLLQLIHLLLGHGMLIVGLPWDETMRTSGSYYGATAHGAVTADDLAQARKLGQRVAEVATRLDAAQPREA
jgi:NAD(P)H dehydrogenase (quinone)